MRNEIANIIRETLHNYTANLKAYRIKFKYY